MKYNQKLKRNLWSWILFSTGNGLSVMVLVGLLLMPRLIETPNMIQHIYGLNGSSFIIIKNIILFSIFAIIFCLMFFIQSANFIKELNLQARSLLSLDKYVQFKEDYRFELMGDDKKYITDHSDLMDSYHYLRRITLRKPLPWFDKLYISTLFILWILYSAVVFFPNYHHTRVFYSGLITLEMTLFLFVYLFRRIKALWHATQKVDELIDNSQGI